MAARDFQDVEGERGEMTLHRSGRWIDDAPPGKKVGIVGTSYEELRCEVIDCKTAARKWIAAHGMELFKHKCERDLGQDAAIVIYRMLGIIEPGPIIAARVFRRRRNGHGAAMQPSRCSSGAP